MIFNQEKFIELVEPFVYVNNDSYKMLEEIYEAENISKRYIMLLEKILNKSNKIIRENSLKGISVKKGIKKKIVDSELYKNKNDEFLTFYWWGVSFS
ncbi:MAG: hypothetical protein ACRCX8_00820 [Sarcina sp.]